MVVFALNAATVLNGQPLQTVQLPAQASSGNVSPPFWSNGFFFVRAYNPSPGDAQVWAYDSKGSLAFQIKVSIPESDTISIQDAVGLKNGGGALLSGLAWSSSAQFAAFLGWVDRNGSLQRVVRTNPFLASRICTAPDGSIWAFGFNAQDPHADDELVRHFTSDGALLGKYATRSSFGSQMHPARVSFAGVPYIGASNDRIGVYSGNAKQWLEFSFDGRLLGSWTVQPPTALMPDGSPPGKVLTVPAIALTDANAVFAWLDHGTNAGVYELDRSSSRWVQVSAGSYSGFVSVSGIQGDQVVMRARHSLSQFAWFAIPTRFNGAAGASGN